MIVKIRGENVAIPKATGYSIIVKTKTLTEELGLQKIQIAEEVDYESSEATTIARVVDMGEAAFNRKFMEAHNITKPPCKVGDIVVIPRFKGIFLPFTNHMYRRLTDDDIYATYDQDEVTECKMDI